MSRRRGRVDDRQTSSAATLAPPFIEGQEPALEMPPKRAPLAPEAIEAAARQALEAHAAAPAPKRASLELPALIDAVATILGAEVSSVLVARAASALVAQRVAEPAYHGWRLIVGADVYEPGEMSEADGGPIGPFSNKAPEVSAEKLEQWEAGQGCDPLGTLPPVETTAPKAKRKRAKKGEAPLVLPGQLELQERPSPLPPAVELTPPATVVEVEAPSSPAAPASYEDFLANKVTTAPLAGFEPTLPLTDGLFPHQADMVRWSLRQGRCALFADCGLGKSFCELEWARHVQHRTGGKVLILTPLAVAGQFVREGEKFGIPVRQIREAADAIEPGIYVSNYDRLNKLDAASFSGVVLDESGILKNYSGATKKALEEAFAATPYKLCGTATPAPNDPMELGNHAQFLGVMTSHMMLTRWFVNDTSAAGVWRLKGHAARDYWRWVCSWAVCVSKPSDLGHSDDGYELPPLVMKEHTVEVDVTEGREEGQLFRDPSLSATKMHAEMRRTNAARSAKVAELVNATPGPWAVWCNTNYEAEELMRLIPDAVEVKGPDPLEKKEAALAAFAAGEIRVLVSKPSICSFGLNWQHCHQMAFVGLSYSYEQLYQALRRSYRFGQKHEVRAHIVAAQTEGRIVEVVREKQRKHHEMQAAMVAAMQTAGLGAERKERTAMDYDVRRASGKGWDLVNGDCVEAVKELPDESIDLIVYSPPFSNLYTYSDSWRDMGNCADDAEFIAHFGYLLGDLLRVTKSGRIMAVHCKQVVDYKGRDGRSGLRDFRGDLIRACEKAGWKFHSEVTIWKCPVTEMQRTKSHGLLYKQLRADSSYSRQGLAEYVCVFRKWSAAGDVAPVTKTPEEFPLEMWQRYASPVWSDIDQTDVLNVQQARENADDKHICPLQLGVIERVVKLWSNPGDLVLSPFAGIGSEGYVSLREGRRFWGAELKEGYFNQASKNLRSVEGGEKQASIFDLLDSNPTTETAQPTAAAE